IAASTVTHTSSPDSTVAEGSIHCRCALAGTTASVAAAIVAVKPRIIFFMPCPFEKSAEGDRNGAEFGLARGASADRKSQRLNSSHACATRLPSSALKKK